MCVYMYMHTHGEIVWYFPTNLFSDLTAISACYRPISWPPVRPGASRMVGDDDIRRWLATITVTTIAVPEGSKALIRDRKLMGVDRYIVST